MIKPTMSHAVNKEHLNELLVAYYKVLLDMAWQVIQEAGYDNCDSELRDAVLDED